MCDREDEGNGLGLRVLGLERSSSDVVSSFWQSCIEKAPSPNAYIQRELKPKYRNPNNLVLNT